MRRKKPKVLFLYGPPASGKLTIAKELAKTTGLRVFHNHLTFDLIHSIIPFDPEDSEHFWEILGKVKRVLIPVAMKRKQSFIFTFCYSHPHDKSIKKHVRAIEKAGGETYFVQLTCDKGELFKRVKAESRKKYSKLTSITKYKQTLKKHDFFTPIKFRESLTIDNTRLSAKRVAKIIQEHFKL